MTKQVISANRLRDGIVVYLTKDNGWSESISNALVLESEKTVSAALAAAQMAEARCQIVAPYLIEIDNDSGIPRPTLFRELIRDKGPSVRPDLGKQAETEVGP